MKNDLKKLTRTEQTQAKVLPSVANSLREAHNLITHARAMAADLVGVESLRRDMTSAASDTLQAIHLTDSICRDLIRKANR